MTVGEAEKIFVKLVNKVYVEGISVDLERDDKVIARLTPAEPRTSLTVGALNVFLRGLPSLGDEADAFAQDDRALRAELLADYAGTWKDHPLLEDSKTAIEAHRQSVDEADERFRPHVALFKSPQ